MSEQSERVGLNELLGAEEIAARQLQETVVQELNGQTVRMALLYGILTRAEILCSQFIK